MKGITVMVMVGIAVVVIFYVGKKIYLKPDIVQGVEAVDFTVFNDGSTLTLSSLRGSYVLLDFWGSWCGPCLKLHPEMVKLYHDFHDSQFVNGNQFEIVSIAFEPGMQYLETIKRNNLTWPYHFQEKDMFESTLAKTYNVRQLPTKFLINPEGIIMAVDPGLDKIREILDSKMEMAENQ